MVDPVITPAVGIGLYKLAEEFAKRSKKRKQEKKAPGDMPTSESATEAQIDEDFLLHPDMANADETAQHPESTTDMNSVTLGLATLVSRGKLSPEQFAQIMQDLLYAQALASKQGPPVVAEALPVSPQAAPGAEPARSEPIRDAKPARPESVQEAEKPYLKMEGRLREWGKMVVDLVGQYQNST